MKIYRSPSDITLRVQLSNPKEWRTIVFLPHSQGGSYFMTAEPRLQNALRCHPRFGSLFFQVKDCDI